MDQMLNPLPFIIRCTKLNGQKFLLSQTQWKFMYTLTFQICKDGKLQWTHVRINHYIFTTNTFLYKIGMINYTICTFREREDESIYRLLKH